jgi:hypothetical protein
MLGLVDQFSVFSLLPFSRAWCYMVLTTNITAKASDDFKGVGMDLCRSHEFRADSCFSFFLWTVMFMNL